MQSSDFIKGGILDGYQEQDVYTITGNTIKRKFSVYNAGDFYNNLSLGYSSYYYSLEKNR